jgi:hypothetical protein
MCAITTLGMHYPVLLWRECFSQGLEKAMHEDCARGTLHTLSQPRHVIFAHASCEMRATTCYKQWITITLKPRVSHNQATEDGDRFATKSDRLTLIGKDFTPRSF